MPISNLWITITALIITILYVPMLVYAFQRKVVPGARALVFMLMAVFVYALPYLFQLASQTHAAALFWYNLSLPGANLIAPAWLIFALFWSGHEAQWIFTKINQRAFMVLLFVVPMVVCLAALTESFHGLYGSNLVYRVQGSLPIIDRNPGFFYWLGFGYAYGVVALAMILVLRSAFSRLRLFLQQSLLLIFGALIPVFANIIHSLNGNANQAIDITPFSFVLTALIWAIAIFVFRFLTILPMAHKNVFSIMPMGMVVLDYLGHVVDMNPTAERILGVSRSIVIGLELPTSITDQLPWDVIHAYSLEHKEEIQLESGGQLRFLEITIKPSFDESKKILFGVLLLFEDVTERKASEEAVQEKTAELENIFNLTPDLLTIANTDGYFLRVSPSWEKTLGYTSEELLNRSFLELIHPDDVVKTMKSMEQLSEQHNVLNFVNRYRCKDGSYRWIEWHAQPVGNLIYAAARDISVRKKMEERLQYQSTHDVLTGLYNRQYYEMELERLQASRLYPISMVVVDMNGLKQVNDVFGHSVGDDRLRQTALLLKGVFRPEDVVARIGGDEFVIVLPHTDQHGVANALERVRITFDEYNQVCPPDQTLSIAIGAATGIKGDLLTEIFRQADHAMYENKKIGR